MKNTLKNFGKFLLILVLVASCQDDDTRFGSILAPTNLELGYQIVGLSTENPNGDGSGNVILTAHADNAMTYKFIYPDGTSDTKASGTITKRFTITGINSYLVTVVAYGKGGVSTSSSINVLDLLSSFDDPVTAALLTGNSQKTWYWAAAEQGHLGVGPNTPTGNNYWPEYYGAAPFEKSGGASSCLYTCKLKFSMDGSLIKYTLENNGSTFFNNSYNSVAGGSGTDDACWTWDVSGQKNVLLSPADSYVPAEFSTGTQMTFTNGGFMGYYLDTSTYEILELTENRMVVRTIMGNNTALAWYHTFTTTDPYGTPDPEFNNLAWADEFNTDGAPDATKWNMETGNGQNGWGNNELEFYRAQNAVVSGGSLKITAKKEDFTNAGITYHYTSARMNTHNHFDFKYGRVDIKAKLPTGQGIWPALWMLGSNYQTNAWPACGEIDIMENKNGESIVQSTLHYPGHFGGSADGTAKPVTGLSTDFKIYSLIWTDSVMKFYVKTSETDPNPILIKQFTNSPTLHPYFNLNFFLIFNVATGGDFVGTAPAADFTQSSMEVDYVRVYQ